MFLNSLTRPTVLIAALAALAFTPAGCGSDDDDDAGQAGAAQTQPAKPASGNGGDATRDDAVPRSDAGQIRQLLADAQLDYLEGNAEAYCARLTAAGRAQVANFGRAYQQGDTCQEVIRKTSATAGETGLKQKPTKLLSVKVNGDIAVAQVSDGGRPPQPLRFVKHADGWKIPNPGFSTNPKPATPIELEKDPRKRVKQMLRLRRELEQGADNAQR
jgi:hypothetical protein